MSTKVRTGCRPLTSSLSPSDQDSIPSATPATNRTDCLPVYDCTVSLEDTLCMKAELHSVNVPCERRSWARVQAKVHGTLLSLQPQPSAHYKPFSYSTGGGPMQVLGRSYTMQGAEVGLALDYYKRPFVLRVRAEDTQFLLAAWSLRSCLQWIAQLGAAIAISTPLDERRMTYPRSSFPRPTAPSGRLVPRAVEDLGVQSWNGVGERAGLGQWAPKSVTRPTLQLSDNDELAYAWRCAEELRYAMPRKLYYYVHAGHKIWFRSRRKPLVAEVEAVV